MPTHEEFIEKLEINIARNKSELNLKNDSFLRQCLVCYSTWRVGYECPTEGCTQHGWTIDYNNYLSEREG
jgi:hypothetical protein